MLLLELDNSDGEDALLLVLGLVSSLVDHQVFSQRHIGAWQGAGDTSHDFRCTMVIGVGGLQPGHHMLNLHIVCELGFCPADWFCNLKNFGFWTF